MVGIGVTSALARCFIVCITFITSILGWLAVWLCGRPNLTTSFIDYVTELWVEEHRFLWNHYQTEGPHTTNHLEGWDNKIKKKVHHAHPNILYKKALLIQITKTQYLQYQSEITDF
jgi:hypothetical protein